MGSSSWRYFTPYQSDAEAALQELRSRVFAEGAWRDALPTAPRSIEIRLAKLRSGTSSTRENACSGRSRRAT
jgi:hypothetical protein